MLGIQYKSQLDVFLTRRIAESITSIDNVTSPDVVDYPYLSSVADIDAGEIIGAGEITDQMIADLSITTSKLANLAVDTTKLANLSVDAAKLANSSVESTKIANAAVGSAAIAALAVGTAHIANAAVGSAAIAALAVGTAHIANLAVDSAKVANTITGKNIVSSSDGNRVSLLAGNYFQVVVSGVEVGKIYGNTFHDIIIEGTDDVTFVAGGAGRCGVHSNSFKPVGDMIYNCGIDGAKWAGVYSRFFYGGSSGTKGADFRSSLSKDSTQSIVGFITAVDLSRSGDYIKIKARFRELLVDGGVVTGVSSQTNWHDVGQVKCV